MIIMITFVAIGALIGAILFLCFNSATRKPLDYSRLCNVILIGMIVGFLFRLSSIHSVTSST